MPYCSRVSERNDGVPGAGKVTHDISSAALFKVCAFAAAIYLLIRLWPILILLIVTLIIVGTLSPAVAALERRRFSRLGALAVVFVTMVAVTGVLAALTIPAMGRELVEIVTHAPQLQSRMATVLERSRVTRSLGPTVREFRVDQILLHGSAGDTLALSTSIAEMIGYFFTAIVLATYLTAGRDHARGAVYAWVPRRFHVRLARITLNLETIVGGYLRGQIITSVAIGIFTFALLAITRVPNALALAAFAALTDVIPFVGGLLATTPAVLVALTRGSAVTTIVLVAMIAYQEFESRVIVPRVYGQALRLSSAVVVIALLVGGKVGGIIGALLALPIAAALRMLIEELRVDLPGDDTDDPRLRARDARAERAYARETAGASPAEAAAVATEIANEIREADSAAGKDPAETPLNPGKE